MYLEVMLHQVQHLNICKLLGNLSHVSANSLSLVTLLYHFHVGVISLNYSLQMSPNAFWKDSFFFFFFFFTQVLGDEKYFDLI